jgi:hypothetical protein
LFFSAACQPHSEAGRVKREGLENAPREEARLSIGVAQVTVFAHPEIVTGFSARRK